MKTLLKIILGSLFLFITTGCDKLEKISGERFQWEYENRDMQTMHTSEYLGQKDGKFFIKQKSMSSYKQSKWKEKILYAEKADLNEDFRTKLEILGKKVDDKRIDIK